MSRDVGGNASQNIRHEFIASYLNMLRQIAHHDWSIFHMSARA